jgi:hypothetical protein
VLCQLSYSGDAATSLADGVRNRIVCGQEVTLSSTDCAWDKTRSAARGESQVRFLGLFAADVVPPLRTRF